MAKYTLTTSDEHSKKLKNKWNDEYILIGDFHGTDYFSTYLHTKCNHTFVCNGNNILRQKIPCPYCNPNSHKNTEIFTWQLNQKYPNEFEVLSEYKGANQEIELLHHACGFSFKCVSSYILHNLCRCPYCAKYSNIWNTEIYKNIINMKTNNEYELVSEYINSKTPIKIRHKACNLSYYATPVDVNEMHGKCPLCTTYSGNWNHEIFCEFMKRTYGDKYTILGKYKTINDTILLKCNECGFEHDYKCGTIRKGSLQCINCSDHISFPEKFFMSLLNQLNIEYIYQYSKRDNKWCNFYRYDFYIPKFNYIIEINGAQHYNKSLKTYEYTHKCDVEKQKIALVNGVSEYIVIDAAISDMNYIMNSIINSRLNELFDLSKVDFHKCQLHAIKSIYYKIYDLHLRGYNNKKIGEILNLKSDAVQRYICKCKKIFNEAS